MPCTATRVCEAPRSFPHNIGLGATRNPDIAEKAGKIAAEEISATGIKWTFAPCIAVPRDERWGRTYEGFGETPELASMFAPAVVRGMQGEKLGAPESVIACAKHFVADGGTDKGVDQGDAKISEQELRAIHLPGYAAAVKAGVGTIMASYSSWNGQRMHGQNTCSPTCSRASWASRASWFPTGKASTI
jgi:beta-glucosidase